jgi:hypothetical protein
LRRLAGRRVALRLADDLTTAVAISLLDGITEGMLLLHPKLVKRTPSAISLPQTRMYSSGTRPVGRSGGINATSSRPPTSGTCSVRNRAPCYRLIR